MGTQQRRSFVACLMLALFLALQLFGASATFHRWLHPDSASPEHQCVITLLSQGHCHHITGEVTAPVRQFCPATVSLPQFSVWVAADFRLEPERAHPFLGA